MTQEFKYIDKAIAREKNIKGWTRAKKEALINGNADELKLLSQKKFSKKMKPAE